MIQYMVVARFTNNRAKRFQSRCAYSMEEIQKRRADIEKVIQGNRILKDDFLRTEIWSREVSEWRKEET